MFLLFLTCFLNKSFPCYLTLLLQCATSTTLLQCCVVTIITVRLSLLLLLLLPLFRLLLAPFLLYVWRLIKELMGSTNKSVNLIHQLFVVWTVVHLVSNLKHLFLWVYHNAFDFETDYPRYRQLVHGPRARTAMTAKIAQADNRMLLQK